LALVGTPHRHPPYTEAPAFGDVMKSVRVSAVIGLTSGAGPAISAQLMSWTGLLDQPVPVIPGARVLNRKLREPHERRANYLRRLDLRGEA